MNKNIKDLILLNLKEIIKLTNAILMWLIGLVGFFASYYEGVGRYDFLSISGILFIMIICAFIISFVKICCLDKNNIVYKFGSTEINICYGDLFESASENGMKNIIVIPVNTAFDTIVDNNIVKYSKHLVSPNTIHGLFINKLIKYGFTVEEIDKRIEEYFVVKGIRHTVELSLEQKPRGKRKVYEPGTVAVIEFNNTNFCLLALATFDGNNNAQCTKDEFVYAIQKFIIFCDKYSQGTTVYLPLMGTNLSRADMSHKESLQSLVALFKLYAAQLHNKINIVIYKADKDKVSIYDAK